MTANVPGPAAMRARQIVIDLSVLVAIGVVLGLLAPLGTVGMSVPARITYWVVLAVSGYAFYKPIGAIVLRLGPLLALPTLPLWAAAVLIASVPMACLVWVVNAGGGAVRTPTFETALVHYCLVALVGAVVTLMFNLIPATRMIEPHAAEPAVPPQIAPTDGEVREAEPVASLRFTDRLSPELGSQLIALEMEDHYVRAHTALGSELVLMRMRDAVAELGGMEGEQVHRSWWVARGSVMDVKREGRNVRLVLDNGIEAPVSRANVSLLKERGWF
ncbi:LytTR family transcriptional regulator DNA-binding domain-containing protein [Qipengyuania sp. GH1]|nr:LytTR family transcriptional regulator DNA-binding domain-containing protein [Qipengyuania aestuarii]